MKAEYFLDSGSDETVLSRSIHETLSGKSSLDEVPVDVFELCLARNDMTVVSRAKTKLDLALEIRAAHTIIRNFEVYMVGAPMDVLIVGQ
jgi:hypothetical protein